ncbi:MAG: nif-specific transcriptional activator NifA [Magnetococcales bacterium]|nr:nif-specific transcriptional activator NifA [Magnetococcales bacterium]MBF0271815.1 nif-specific transcriptional activator NifA [Magnetococcales bacterium]
MEILEPFTEDVIFSEKSVTTTYLRALFHVGQALQLSADPRRTMQSVAEALHRYADMEIATITLVELSSGSLVINAMAPMGTKSMCDVCYRSGEGVLGTVLAAGRTILVPRAGDEPRFLNKCGLLERHLPFIGVPIRIGEQELVGVLAVQPKLMAAEKLMHHAWFLEMVSHLLVQSILLARKVEEEKRNLAEHRDRLLMEVRNRYGFDNVIGRSASMRQVFDQVRMVSKWNTTVLLRGESGTGKELIAHAIHFNSPRAKLPFIKLNCAALPDNVLESELFGHEKGAFTGAVGIRRGRFELAHGGTLFLDELGEISPTFQAKLLRVLQEGEFERVGGEQTLRVDVRIIAATNRNLEEAVQRGLFRQDLYYRLNVMTITLPSLSSRKEDIPEISRFLLARIAKRQGRRLVITDATMRLLLQHDWPGNVRELENCLERAAVMSEGNILLPDSIVFATALGEIKPASVISAPAFRLPETEGEEEMGEGEKERVIQALRKTGWVKAKAARLLGLTPRQIAYRIKIFGIETETF